MFALIISCLLVVICILNVLLIFGFPLGEFTMGGQHKILPKKLRVMAALSLLIQIFITLFVLHTGGHFSFNFQEKVTKILCFVFAVYFTLNTFMNLISYSKKEKYTMTPLSLVTAIYFWMTAFRM